MLTILLEGLISTAYVFRRSLLGLREDVFHYDYAKTSAKKNHLWHILVVVFLEHFIVESVVC